jgi:hypothetical protein
MTEKKGEYRIEGRDKTIFRAKHDPNNPYVSINRNPITDPLLSYKAKGILAYLLSRPDGWEVNVPDLVNHSTDGPASVRTGLKELRAAGHIHYNTQREGGYIRKWVVEVYEIPVPPDMGDTEGEAALDSDFRNVGTALDSDFLQVENLQVGNRGEVLKNLSINDKKIIEKDAQKKQVFDDYWDTLIDQIKDDPEIPLTNRRRISAGIPARWNDKTLVINHEEAEWATTRFGRLFTNMLQGLCPGAKIVFEQAAGVKMLADKFSPPMKG